MSIDHNADKVHLVVKDRINPQMVDLDLDTLDKDPEVRMDRTRQIRKVVLLQEVFQDQVEWGLKTRMQVSLTKCPIRLTKASLHNRRIILIRTKYQQAMNHRDPCNHQIDLKNKVY